jgi:syntaxin 1B/2/3
MAQYGQYNQVGYGANPFDEREAGGERYNNYSQGRYDDRTFSTQYNRVVGV